MKPCAQPSTGAASVASGLPLRVADQPPAASASTRVPEVPGASTVFTPIGPEGTGTAVPAGVTTRARATVPETCHRSYEDDLVSGCRPAAAFSWLASAWSAGAGIRTYPMSNWLSARPVSPASPLPAADSEATTPSMAFLEAAVSASSGSPGTGSAARTMA